MLSYIGTQALRILGDTEGISFENFEGVTGKPKSHEFFVRTMNFEA